MKKPILIFITAILSICMVNCQKIERDNPWDEKATLDPNEWAPQNFQVEDVSITEKKLSWTFDDKNIEGFKLDRKKGDEPWQVAFQTFAKEDRSWHDTDIVPDPALTYSYRLYTYAGQNVSGNKTTTASAEFPAPTNLIVIRNTITSVTLNWQSNSTGEEGFRIERKQGTGNWELLTTLTGISYTDDAFELNTDVSYRVAAYYGQFASDYIGSSFNSQIPPPENLTITANSASSITLNWSYSLTGHSGFKIERKIDNGNWEMLADNLNPNQNSFIDNQLDLPQHDYTYRVFAFLGGFQSNYAVAAAQPSIGGLYKGGIVFYLDGNGGGLVCAESDQSTGAAWGCQGTSIGGTGTGIGTGAANTAAIVAGCSETGIAARICNNLVLNGYSDWFLPSKDELNLMYQNLKLNGIGGFADNKYWSSSEYSTDYAWRQDFTNGSQLSYDKGSFNRVRAVRAF